ncbi:hypothetical protein [Streptomyces sp. NBC_01264]|uniref:hypothetical protein n=1 Tax=Streptomyces sp. NBC_01264 TaxID=2903804 RepID=UPI002250001E|nr:hypothetical protein [Streptomyces sp. NBC_01264]MCX4781606.1 hypothetical protein [Streptomyces sp. NBC_01264]MCX4784378.1 hypothetical protein [Streptomyces sp. NBC_01264]
MVSVVSLMTAKAELARGKAMEWQALLAEAQEQVDFWLTEASAEEDAVRRLRLALEERLELTDKAAVVRGAVASWEPGRDESVLPGVYRAALAVVREVKGPVLARQVAEKLGWEATPARQQRARDVCSRLAARGWIVKRGDGRFTRLPG